MNDAHGFRDALIAAFPPAPIARATIDAGRWEPYSRRDELPLFEDRSWLELEPSLLERHQALLTYAGDELYRALLPAYLLFLIEIDDPGAVPFHVAGQLSRHDDRVDQQIFDERTRPMTSAQRTVVRRVIEHLATRASMHEPMTVALRSW